MSHAMYQTSAVILKTKNMRESNKLVVLYTERFGLIYATMQSVRELKSKMKYHVNTLSLVTVDIVQGRDIWRITGIHEQQSSLGFVGTPFYTFLHNISVFLLRLSQGEETNQELWNDLKSLYEYDKETLALKDYKIIEIITIARLLFYLGYWDGTQNVIQSDSIFSIKNREDVAGNISLYIRYINQGIKDSQL
jgi:recombinational DNA repair protein (RecF pathway)